MQQDLRIRNPSTTPSSTAPSSPDAPPDPGTPHRSPLSYKRKSSFQEDDLQDLSSHGTTPMGSPDRSGSGQLSPIEERQPSPTPVGSKYPPSPSSQQYVKYLSNTGSHPHSPIHQHPTFVSNTNTGAKWIHYSDGFVPPIVEQQMVHLHSAIFQQQQQQQQHHHHHHHHHPGSPPPPPPQPSAQQQNLKKISKPMIEKRRRDRINRCLNLLKQIIIDSKRYPVPNYNKSRFEKADILEITVKYLESLIIEERGIYQQGFDDCKKEVAQFLEAEIKLSSATADDDDGDSDKTTNPSSTIKPEPEEESEVTKMITDDTGKSSVDSEIFKRLLEHLERATQKNRERTTTVASNLNSLYAELNDMKTSRSASISDSDQHSADEMLSDHYNSDNESYWLSQGKPAKGVIQHTRNYHNQRLMECREAIMKDGGTTDSHLIKKLDQLNLDQQSRRKSVRHDEPLNLKSNNRLWNGSVGSSSSSSLSSASSTSSTSSSSSSASSTKSDSSSAVPRIILPHGGIPNLTLVPSPFYSEMNINQPRINFIGNERNGGAGLSNYEALWRPWGYGHQ